MKAVGFYQYLPIEEKDSFLNVEVPDPVPGAHDLVVRVKAVSVNPVDTKTRMSKGPEVTEKEPQIIGWDASGIVESVGEHCQVFKPGDEVFYAGDKSRPGAYGEKHIVDERIVGKKPRQLSFAESAAVPLTAITAWEGMFTRLGINSEKDQYKSILIIGGAGGVGSIAIQLAKWAGLHVIATASRPETEEWCRKMGADEVINHREPILPQLETLDFESVPYIFCLNDTAYHWKNMVDSIAPQGKICSIVGSKEALDLSQLQHKSVTFAWEYMFTRPMLQTDDMIAQHRLLTEVSELLDKEALQTTLTETLSPLEATTVKEAHKKVESGKMIGKIVIEVQ